MPSLIDVILRRNLEEPEVPVCPDHHQQMRVRGKLGKPTRFAEQSEEEYSFIYFCPVDECNATAFREKVRTQVPVPGASPERPIFSRSGERNPL